MSRKFKFTINKDRLLDATVDFHIHYGNAMARWAQLENALYLWFSAATAMNDAVGRAIFYSARGFAARAEMLEAAVEHATTLSPEQIEFLKEAIKKARQYSGFRNKVAHGEPRVHLYENEEGEKRRHFLHRPRPPRSVEGRVPINGGPRHRRSLPTYSAVTNQKEYVDSSGDQGGDQQPLSCVALLVDL